MASITEPNGLPPAPPVASPAADVTAGGGDKATIAKLTAQLKRLTEANAKYKNLLKLAKDRIQTAEEELTELKQDNKALQDRLENDEKEAAKHIALDEASDGRAAPAANNVVRVCQRIKDRTSVNASTNGMEEIWALMLVEIVNENETTTRQYKQWMKFNAESELQDFIRRDTGEPITLPPYSLSPEQSAQIQQEAEKEVSKITEEFRRFRVRAELARKRADAQIRDLQNIKKLSAAERITETHGNNTGLPSDSLIQQNSQIEKLKAEKAALEVHWKEAYDMLLAENNSLKSAGSEALLAAQWRQRYESCLKEKEDLQVKLKAQGNGNSNDYEAKYRDLKGVSLPYQHENVKIYLSRTTIRIFS
jgi:chromosome segregation ATPase